MPSPKVIISLSNPVEMAGKRRGCAMAEQIPREFIELLLAKIDLVDLINTQIPLRKKSGSNYFARCPFHQEKNASFSVSQPKQFYYCFGCAAHGNAIDFLMQHDRLSFPEAIETLARQVGMEIPTLMSKKEDSLPALFELMTRITAYYYDQMRQSERAIHYLKLRGVTGTSAQLFSIGYAPPGWSHLLEKFDKSPTDQKKLLDTGLIIKKSEGGHYDRFRDRIIFPIHDYRGRIIGFGGRIIDQGEPKYLNSPETVLFQKGHELYGLYQTLKMNRKLERVLIVEGYMDVIALFQYGINYAVATLGTATSSHHLQRLFRYTSEIIFCFDGDQAGRSAAWRAVQTVFTVMHDSLQIRFLFLPEGEDPDSLIRKEGKAKFESRIQSATSLSSFFFHTLTSQADMNTMEGRARFAALSLTHIKKLSASIFQDILIEELAKRARVGVSELKQQIKNQEHIQTPISSSKYAKTKIAPPVHLVMKLLVQHPPLAGLLKEPLPPPFLPGMSFLSQLIEIIQKSPHITTGGLLEYFRGQKEEPFIIKLAQWEPVIPWTEISLKNEFLGGIRQILSLGFDEEINRLLAKAAQIGLQEEEKTELSTWIAKKKNLGEALIC